MSRHAKSQRIIDVAAELLADGERRTVRQIYYQLISRQVLENSRAAYQAVSNALVTARKEGLIAWEAIEDRLRQPRCVPMWENLTDFMQTVVASYRRDLWRAQPRLLEVWLEKDALSGIFEDALQPYGVTLNVGRGYDGWDSIYRASQRFGDGTETGILYFGDFDPSGEDMVISLRARLGELGCQPEIVKCALRRDDIEQYNLPPMLPKKSDTRYAGFVAKHGALAVELDALPVEVLRERLITEVEARMDIASLEVVKAEEEADRERLLSIAEALDEGQP